LEPGFCSWLRSPRSIYCSTDYQTATSGGDGGNACDVKMRAEFSKATKLEAWLRAHGCCEGCGVEFGGRRPEYDHDKPAELGGDNSLENCKCLCPKCHRAKTSFEDMPVIWKSNRVREKGAGLRRGKFIPYRLADGTPVWRRK